MVRIITVDDVKSLVRKVTLPVFMQRLIDRLQEDYAKWQSFDKMPRIATHVDHGVLELMPICNEHYYSFKFVNGHPKNPTKDKLTVTAVGMLADTQTGYPLLISEMTVLTAIRTAATSALAAKYLARKNSKTFAMIGCGAQSEFQVIAHACVLPLEQVNFYDIDADTMNKFAKNLKKQKFKLNPCKSVQEAVALADVVTTATARKERVSVLSQDDVRDGMHINGIGGDCPGKTELDQRILEHTKIVVELLAQTKIEGELQNFDKKEIYAELWELAAGKKPGRENDTEITLFDSVGFAIEDYSVLRLVHTLAEELHVGHMMDMIPEMGNPKDLFGLL